ncbi:MAG: hypothetical protein E7K04_00875 [Helicobacter sp.]|nr:hypothetical protein [Helicobacter sp.]
MRALLFILLIFDAILWWFLKDGALFLFGVIIIFVLFLSFFMAPSNSDGANKEMQERMNKKQDKIDEINLKIATQAKEIKANKKRVIKTTSRAKRDYDD